MNKLTIMFAIVAALCSCQQHDCNPVQQQESAEVEYNTIPDDEADGDAEDSTSAGTRINATDRESTLWQVTNANGQAEKNMLFTFQRFETNPTLGLNDPTKLPKQLAKGTIKGNGSLAYKTRSLIYGWYIIDGHGKRYSWKFEGIGTKRLTWIYKGELLSYPGCAKFKFSPKNALTASAKLFWVPVQAETKYSDWIVDGDPERAPGQRTFEFVETGKTYLLPVGRCIIICQLANGKQIGTALDLLYNKSATFKPTFEP